MERRPSKADDSLIMAASSGVRGEMDSDWLRAGLRGVKPQRAPLPSDP